MTCSAALIQLINITISLFPLEFYSNEKCICKFIFLLLHLLIYSSNLFYLYKRRVDNMIQDIRMKLKQRAARTLDPSLR